MAPSHHRPFDLDFDSSDDDEDDDSDADEHEEDITDQIGREIASQIFLNYGDVFEDGKEGGEGITEIPLGEINFTSSGKAGGGGGGGGDSLDETIPPAMRKRIEEAVSGREGLICSTCFCFVGRDAWRLGRQVSSNARFFCMFFSCSSGLDRVI